MSGACACAQPCTTRSQRTVEHGNEHSRSQPVERIRTLSTSRCSVQLVSMNMSFGAGRRAAEHAGLLVAGLLAGDLDVVGRDLLADVAAVEPEHVGLELTGSPAFGRSITCASDTGEPRVSRTKPK